MTEAFECGIGNGEFGSRNAEFRMRNGVTTAHQVGLKIKGIKNRYYSFLNSTFRIPHSEFERPATRLVFLDKPM